MAARIKKYIVLSDIQLPFYETSLFEFDATGRKPVKGKLIEFLLGLKPDGIVLAGDIVDCYSISDFTRDPLRPETLLTEVLLAQSLMKAFKGVPDKLWIGGNHEDRLRRYIWHHAPALGFLEDCRFENLFNLSAHKFRWLPYRAHTKLGKLAITHGHYVRKHSAISAKAHFEDYGSSVLHGHTHRLGRYYRTDLSGVHVSVENGCLCSLEPEYTANPNWQQGFHIVHVHPQGWFHVTQIEILKSAFWFYGDAMYHV